MTFSQGGIPQSATSARGVFHYFAGVGAAQCRGMMDSTEPAFVPSGRLVPFTGQLWLAVATCLAPFQGLLREQPNPVCAVARPSAPNGLGSPACLAAVGTAVGRALVVPLQGKQAQDGRSVSS
jgi:hypothetical protein